MTKIVLVTGTSTGLGLAIAVQAADRLLLTASADSHQIKNVESTLAK